MCRPPLGATPRPNSNIADISATDKWISTIFSVISLVTRILVLGEQILKYVTPS